MTSFELKMFPVKIVVLWDDNVYAVLAGSLITSAPARFCLPLQCLPPCSLIFSQEGGSSRFLRNIGMYQTTCHRFPVEVR